MLTLMLIGAALTCNIHSAMASETIYIRADGSIDPPTATISSPDDVTYTFTDDIYDSIVVQRSNIIIDGNGHTLQGSGSGDGFTLGGTSNVTIQNTNIKGFGIGIQIFLGSQNTISGNNITANSLAGIWINYYSDYNSISGNNITANDYSGILLYSSSFNTIIGNNITEPRDSLTPIPYGIFLEENSGNNMISGNNITGLCLKGIWNEGSSYNTISGNNITNNVADPGDWDPDYSFDGIHVVSSSYITISLNNITANHFGIWISFGSYYNTISGNNITNNSFGILINEYWPQEMEPSNNNTISGNDITANHWYGIYFDETSSFNTVMENSIRNNFMGIYESANNRFYHNSFIDNSLQVIYHGVSAWDDGYPSGGNYWSDYAGVDLSWGAYQNKIGSDGIGDIPYTIAAGNRDNYPLMSPYEYWNNPTPGDINKDTKVDLNDLSQIAVAYGSSTQSSYWNPNSDINEDDKVDVSDLFTVGKNYGETAQIMGANAVERRLSATNLLTFTVLPILESSLQKR